MTFIADLWLPIVLSALFVFIASSILHMVLPLHRTDYRKLDAEDAVLNAVRSAAPQPGQYMFPSCASMKDMSSPEMVEKYKRGPVGLLTVLPPGPPNMGKLLAMWFLYTALVSLFAGYLVHAAFPAGGPYLEVFRFAGTVAFAAYGLGAISDSIWKGQKWAVTGKFIFDGVVYALVTGGTFGWLWAAEVSALPAIPA